MIPPEIVALDPRLAKQAAEDKAVAQLAEDMVWLYEAAKYVDVLIRSHRKPKKKR